MFHGDSCAPLNVFCGALVGVKNVRSSNLIE